MFKVCDLKKADEEIVQDSVEFAFCVGLIIRPATDLKVIDTAVNILLYIIITIIACGNIVFSLRNTCLSHFIHLRCQKNYFFKRLKFKMISIC